MQSKASRSARPSAYIVNAPRRHVGHASPCILLPSCPAWHTVLYELQQAAKHEVVHQSILRSKHRLLLFSMAGPSSTQVEILAALQGQSLEERFRSLVTSTRGFPSAAQGKSSRKGALPIMPWYLHIVLKSTSQDGGPGSCPDQALKSPPTAKGSFKLSFR